VARAWLQSILPGAVVAARTNGRDPMLALATAGVGLACLARIAGERRRSFAASSCRPNRLQLSGSGCTVKRAAPSAFASWQLTLREGSMR